MITYKQIKIVILGEGNQFFPCFTVKGRVGKTSLLLKFVKNAFNQSEQSTLQADFLEKQIEISPGKTVVAQLWDTAGQEQFRALAPMYYRDAAGALLVYDVSNKESLQNAQQWIKELKQYNQNQESNMKLFIVGNKNDLPSFQHVITKSEGEQVAKQCGALHMLTSAKTGEGVDTVFVALAKNIMKDNQVIDRDSISMTDKKHQERQREKKKQQSSCC